MMTLIVALVLAAVLLVLAARVTWAVWRFVRSSPAARRNYLPMIRARIMHRWLCKNQQLAYVDQHKRAAMYPRLGTVTRIRQAERNGYALLRYPRARRWRADEYGWSCRVRTIPRVGRRQWEDASEHVSNAWRTTRVQVSQPRPGGRLVIRGLRRDPLTEPLTADWPDPPSPSRVLLGKDEWGTWRDLSLSGIAGITVAGMPGYGKTQFVLWLLGQLARSLAVRPVILDQKGGGDFDGWRPRCWLFSGDDLDESLAVLEDLHQEMRRRLATVVQVTGSANAWHRGPQPDFPLIFTIIDEAHGLFDLDGCRGQKETENKVRRARSLVTQLVKRGRSVLFVTVLITQKQDSTAIPTAIRDVCSVGFSFATRTVDGAVCALGENIRQYPTLDPSTLQDPAYIGVTVANLRTNNAPYVRLRIPEVPLLTPDAARERETAGA